MSFIDSNSEDQPGFEKHGRAARSRRGVRLTTSRYLAVAIGPANLQYKYCVARNKVQRDQLSLSDFRSADGRVYRCADELYYRRRH
ncbi:hypothetical protein Y032_0003g1222 [Ancylostoma ceylanicum]|uniref:Uncharacterized protein n=1 Tax=Ancylostoma ceylanicum TaxID=53326 RepID=A0A016VWG5_9BILA|nr:hypothetical protein Y032_0003g1222 [Ancylostoma ceylanicum]